MVKRKPTKSKSPKKEERKRSRSATKRQLKHRRFDTETEPVRTSKMSSGWGVFSPYHASKMSKSKQQDEPIDGFFGENDSELIRA